MIADSKAVIAVAMHANAVILIGWLLILLQAFIFPIIAVAVQTIFAVTHLPSVDAITFLSMLISLSFLTVDLNNYLVLLGFRVFNVMAFGLLSGYLCYFLTEEIRG